MKAILRFTTLQTNGYQKKHIFIAKNYKGKIFTIQDGNEFYKYKNVIYESIKDAI